jgi:mevalonate pyrophosphate decarboxylase
MTTVSVQPTTSEPNERDIPTMSHFANVNDCVLAREKWYQDRIESLQAKLDHKQRYLDAMDIKGGYAKLESENNALQAQLTKAVAALNYYKQFPILGDKAIEALIEIKKIGE